MNKREIKSQHTHAYERDLDLVRIFLHIVFRSDLANGIGIRFLRRVLMFCMFRAFETFASVIYASSAIWQQ